MIKNRINLLKKNFKTHAIDGYIIPKNDEFFSEYSRNDRLKFISGFDGSAGLAVILKKKNYIFVDGRYTIQAKNQCKNVFNVCEISKTLPHKIIKKLTIGYDPRFFTKNILNFYFKNNVHLKPISKNLIDLISNKKNFKEKPFFSIKDNIVGEGYKSRIKSISKILKKKKVDYLFITAPENVAWILNIRGSDSPFSPIPNCNLIIGKNEQIFLLAKKSKTINLIKEKKLSNKQIINPENIDFFLKNLKGQKIILDGKTCSIHFENLIRSRFSVLSFIDPCYSLKSIKNYKEINHMIKAHVEDGIALTKFIYWIKNLRSKKITEIQAQNKLEKFRKDRKNYLFPSFNTIAGTGSNGAIIHYRANKKTNKIIKKKDLFLCDSGGQYKYGTTDVTRTISFVKQPKKIKDIFTKVLKGHIAVAMTKISKNTTGKEIDINARKFLKKSQLDYPHGTGHGVGFFLNVHEGPQTISKYNNTKFREGMILSNEPGYYKNGKFGIRIENLIYIKKIKKKLFFENLTLAPIEKDLINYKLLSNNEKDYLQKYHSSVYSKLSKYLNEKEKKWLIGNI